MEHTKNFPLGFWCYRSFNNCTLKDVEIWRDCGMNMVVAPHFKYGVDDLKHATEILDKCLEFGISVIPDIAGLSYGDFKTDEEYIEILKKACDDFGHHKAVFGFHIGDEPQTDDAIAICVKAYKLNKQYAPHLQPFLNQLAYPHETAEYLPKTFKAMDLTLASYDYYAQLNPEEEGIDSYYRNLHIFSEASKGQGCDLWNTVLSVGHFRYRCPTEDDLRWQLHTSVACGCNGIMWFYFYNGFNNNYRGAPINEYGEKSPTYYYLSLIQRRFQDMFGKLFMDLKLKETYQFNKIYSGYEEFPVNTHNIVHLKAAHHVPGIISFFENEEGQEYAVLVNNSQTESDMFYIVCDKDVKEINRIAYNETSVVDLRKHSHDAFYRKEDNTAGVWLAPGQMEVFVLKK